MYIYCNICTYGRCSDNILQSIHTNISCISTYLHVYCCFHLELTDCKCIYICIWAYMIVFAYLCIYVQVHMLTHIFCNDTSQLFQGCSRSVTPQGNWAFTFFRHRQLFYRPNFIHPQDPCSVFWFSPEVQSHGLSQQLWQVGVHPAAQGYWQPPPKNTSLPQCADVCIVCMYM